MKMILCILMLAALTQAEPVAAPSTEEVEVTRVYDIHSLVDPVSNYPLPVSLLPTLPGDANHQITPGDVPPVISRQDRLESLTVRIQKTIPVASKDMQDSPGYLAEVAGSLIVTQTESNQAKIEKMLSALSAEASRTVRVTADWVYLSRDQLRAVNADEAKSADTLSTIDEEMLGKAKLLCHVQTSGLNGQLVHAICTEERSYVSSSTPVIAQSIAVFQPTMSQIQSGAALQVLPRLQGNRALVDIFSVVGMVNDLPRGPYSTIVTTQPTSSETAGDVQRPAIDSQEIHTTVNLPLGKSVLIGGISTLNGESSSDISQLSLVVRVDAH